MAKKVYEIREKKYATGVQAAQNAEGSVLIVLKNGQQLFVNAAEWNSICQFGKSGRKD